MLPLLPFAISIAAAVARSVGSPGPKFGADPGRDDADAIAGAVSALVAAGIDVPDMPASRMRLAEMRLFLARCSDRGLRREGQILLSLLGMPASALERPEGSYGAVPWDRNEVARAMLGQTGQESFGADGQAPGLQARASAYEPIVGYVGAPPGWFQ